LLLAKINLRVNDERKLWFEMKKMLRSRAIYTLLQRLRTLKKILVPEQNNALLQRLNTCPDNKITHCFNREKLSSQNKHTAPTEKNTRLETTLESLNETTQRKRSQKNTLTISHRKDDNLLLNQHYLVFDGVR
jgi:hypothetical protein